MSDLFWLTDGQMARMPPFFRSHTASHALMTGVLSVGLSALFAMALRWRDTPTTYGPHKTLYSRWRRWSGKGIFARIMTGLAAEHGEEKTVMNDATYLKAHCTATSMAVKEGGVAA